MRGGTGESIEIEIELHWGRLRRRGGDTAIQPYVFSPFILTAADYSSEFRYPGVIKPGNDEACLECIASGDVGEEEGHKALSLDELKESLQKALKDLEVARLSSAMFEENAQTLLETAITLKDEATNAWDDVNRALGTVQDVINEETIGKEEVQKAILALSLAEASLNVAVDSLKTAKENNGYPNTSKESDPEDDIGKEDSSNNGVLLASREYVKQCQDHLEKMRG